MTERRGQLYLGGGALFLLLLFALLSPLRSALFPPILTSDAAQTRQNVAMHIPQGSFTINQTFVPRYNGLQEIELQLVRYSEREAAEAGRFTVTLHDDTGEIVASSTYLTRHLSANQALILALPAQPTSAGRQYRLELSGSADNTVTVRGYDANNYPGGRAELRAASAGDDVPDIRAADIYFISRSRLTGRDAWWALLTVSWYQGYLLPLIGAILLLPGALVLRTAPLRRLISDPPARWGTAVALGVAVWPLIWQFSSRAGWRWTRPSLLILLGGGWIFWLGLLLWQRRGSKRRRRRPWRLEHSLLLLLLLAALIVRLLAVREVNAPLWVDASRHGLITMVMAGSGQTISNYAPFLPVEEFPYHDGFHTLPAMLQLISGPPLTELLLYLGQLLNALTPLTTYAGLWLATRDRRAALLAAFLVALPFFFPAYYATWGRFTQLAAMLLLPVLLGLFWQINRGARGWRHLWWAAALLLAGLFLVHIRVFIYFLLFPPLVWLYSRARHSRSLLLATGAAMLLLLPRSFDLLAQAAPEASFTSSAAGAYFQFPTSYYQAGWDRYFIWLAGLLLILLLAAALDRRRWSALPLLLAGWVLLQFLLVGGGVIGYPVPSFLNLNSMYITLYLPLALYLAALAGGTRSIWRRWPSWLQGSGRFLAGALLAVLAIFGIRQQITIINPVTVLAHPADIAAIQWLDGALPADARFAVNSWLWLNGTWAGGDGGAWILPLSGRMTSTPPVDYAFDQDLAAEVAAFNERATAVADWSAPEAAQWLIDEGWTHVFVGVRGGFYDPAQLRKNPLLTQVYARNGVFIFEIMPFEKSAEVSHSPCTVDSPLPPDNGQAVVTAPYIVYHRVP